MGKVYVDRKSHILFPTKNKKKFIIFDHASRIVPV